MTLKNHNALWYANCVVAKRGAAMVPLDKALATFYRLSKLSFHLQRFGRNL